MLIRFAVGFLVTVVLLVVGGLILGGVFMSGTVPTLSGTSRVVGIASAVSIDRDEHGVPHVFAVSDDDGYFGLGYAHAQDRLFQMEMTRRIGRGRLSELVGKEMAQIDIWAKTIGFARIADQMWIKASPETRRILTAYSKGVNAYINEHSHRLGFEFDALHFTPSAWRPEDCLMIGRLMAWEMNFSYWSDAAFTDIAANLDAERLSWLFPDYPEKGATVIEGASSEALAARWQLLPSRSDSVRASEPKKPAAASVSPASPASPAAPASSPRISESSVGASVTGTTSQQFSKVDRSEREAFLALNQINREIAAVFGRLGGGSNAIAIAPSKSQSGGAVLTNDTHLALSSPARWHMVHLHSEQGLNIAGFAVPGLPAIISGRNGEISWGVTNSMADESDFFIETLDTTGRRYLTSEGSQRFTEIIDSLTIRDSIRTRPSKTVRLQIRLTTRGPVISDIHPFRITQLFHSDKHAGGVPRDTTIFERKRPITVQWNGMYVVGDELGSFFKLHRSKSIAEAKASFANFATPCLNLCLASKSGEIAYQYVGRMPRRNGDERSILLARDAMDPAQAWQGFLTTSALPGLSNPERGYIVSANNPPTRSRSIPFSNQWEPPARAERISQLVYQAHRIDTSALRSIMLDVTSPFDRDVVLKRLLSIYPDPNPPRLEPDSTSKWTLDSMKMAWRLDSIRQRASAQGSNITDSMLREMELRDSLLLARPGRIQTNKIVRLEPAVERALDYLRNWDGAMRSNEVAPTIHSVFLQYLLENTFKDELGPERFNAFLYLNNVPTRTLTRILDDPTNVWWDDVKTRGAFRETRDSIIKLSFYDALRELRNRFGPDMRLWQWGKLHTLTYKHQFNSAGGVVAKLVNIESGAAPGGPTTAYQASYQFFNPYEMKIGPSMRMIADMSKRVLWASLPTGNSEAIFGDNYSDMVDLFKRGELIEIPLDDRKPTWTRYELLPAR